MKFARRAARDFLRRQRRDVFLRHLPQGSIGAEVGVYKGDFSARILRIVRPVRLHLIDPWLRIEEPGYDSPLVGPQGPSQAGLDAMYESVLRRFRRAIEEGRVVVHRETSIAAAASLEDGSLDWVYIDADHRYQAVKSDLALYHQKVKKGGFIGGDDYGLKGWWDGGVTRAVEEFRANGGCETVLLQGYQFLLRKL